MKTNSKQGIVNATPNLKTKRESEELKTESPLSEKDEVKKAERKLQTNTGNK